MTTPSKPKYLGSIRRIARTLGILVFLLTLLQLDFQDNPLTLNALLPYIGNFLIISGLVVAWFREGIGGLIIIGGFVYFLAVRFISQLFPPFWVFALTPIIGFLYLFYWWQSRKLTS